MRKYGFVYFNFFVFLHSFSLSMINYSYTSHFSVFLIKRWCVCVFFVCLCVCLGVYFWVSVCTLIWGVVWCYVVRSGVKRDIEKEEFYYWNYFWSTLQNELVKRKNLFILVIWLEFADVAFSAKVHLPFKCREFHHLQSFWWS